MTDILLKISDILLDLLDPGAEKTATHLTEELRVEYPALYENIIDTWAKTFDLSGCGAQMSPVTVVSQVLCRLHEEGVITKEQKNGDYFWTNKNLRT